MASRYSSILSPTGTLRSEGLTYDAFGRMDALTVDQDTVAYAFHHDTAFPTTSTVSRDGVTSVSQTRVYDRRGRLDSIDASDGSSTLFSAVQTFDTHGRVTRINLDGGAYWDYGYDLMGQVTSGVKKDSVGTALPGYTFGYGFDTIGNRESATRESTTDDYWTNALNQITTIEYQGYHHVLGSADSAAAVTVDGLATQRSNSLFYGSVSGGNTYEQFEISGVLAGAGDGGTDAVSVIDAAAYIPESSNTFTHDESGNLTEDAEWTYNWDAENRLVQMETRAAVVTAGAPHRRLTFEYDSQSRRTRKTVETWDGAAWQTDEDIRFLWNDWLLSTELEADTLEPIRSYTWGLDRAGTREQTGGVGGLTFVKHHKNGEVSVPLYTTNGNVRGYWEIDADELVAEFEYGPFGELLKATGEKVGKHPFRWSTKYEDTENGLLYYGYRFFDPSTGRWLSRDPLKERGGINLYVFAENKGTFAIDLLGLISIEFNAFIPSRIGQTIAGLPGTWAEEPPSGLSPWYFSTDNRGFGGGSARIRSVTSFTREDIGSMEGKTWFETSSSPTTRVRRNPLLGGFGDNTQFDTQTETSRPQSRKTVDDLAPCKSRIRIEAWGNYPFVSSSPDIDYTAVWTISLNPKTDEVTIELRGSHNLFPNYEGLADTNQAYEFDTSFSGPSVWNLGIRWTRFRAESITLE